MTNNSENPTPESTSRTRPAFSARWRGYDRVQVDAYVEHQRRLADALRDRAQRAEARLTTDATVAPVANRAPQSANCPPATAPHGIAAAPVTGDGRPTVGPVGTSRTRTLEPPVAAGAGARPTDRRLAQNGGPPTPGSPSSGAAAETRTDGQAQDEHPSAARSSRATHIGVAAIALAIAGAVVGFGMSHSSASARPESMQIGATRPQGIHAWRGVAPVPLVVLEAIPHGRCWVQVRSSGPKGPAVFEGTLAPGVRWSTRSNRALWVEVGWASHLHLTIAGRVLTLTGGPTVLTIRGSSVRRS